MVDITASSAHDVVRESIEFLLDNGTERDVWGGTIPEDPDDPDAARDFEREMIEYTDGFSYKLTNPRKRWCEWSNHWPGITLRETEDDIYCLNPGMVAEYSSIYQSWLRERDAVDTADEFFPHTYGERMQNFGGGPMAMNDRRPVNQWERVREMLRENPTTRKAVMTFWDPHVDTSLYGTDNVYVPCNVTFQLRVVDGQLNWHTFCRSKDILRGATENLFEFPLLQELMANQLDVDVGKYTCQIANLHIYQEQLEGKNYLDEPIDPYEHFPEDEVSVDPWDETLGKKMQRIDGQLQEGNFESAVEQMQEIHGSYWRSWKAALVAEYIRMESDDGQALYRQCYADVHHPWKVALAKRASEEWGDNEWIYEGLPDQFHEEVRSWER